MDKAGRTTDPSIDTESRDRTIAHAGATLHTGITVRHAHQVFNLGENLMRADLQTHSAANADVTIEPQRSYPVKISESFHLYACLILVKNTGHCQHGTQHDTASHNRQGYPHFFLYPGIGSEGCTAGKIQRIIGAHRR